MPLRNLAHRTLAPLAVAATLLSATGALAQDGAVPAASPVKGEMLTWIKAAEVKLIELAEAMPEGKYGWSPDKGVRTVGEVFMHVAAANYGVPSFIGVPPPAGFKFGEYEHSLTKKADIVKSLRDSFAHMERSLEAMSDADMEKPAEFFGMKTTARGAYFLLLSHAHEHLGQSIAYARSNKVTPPWTAREQAAAAKPEKK
jgi:uncharacterized damage-inducible protein DinB